MPHIRNMQLNFLPLSISKNFMSIIVVENVHFVNKETSLVI